ncbi:MAG TPA: hypothetical protein ENN46_01935 [Candidatus Woesearchaeota archaeon]|nr:hypothetical protein [Candidatus Woesearchaeota archaeon]
MKVSLGELYVFSAKDPEERKPLGFSVEFEKKEKGSIDAVATSIVENLGLENLGTKKESYLKRESYMKKILSSIKDETNLVLPIKLSETEKVFLCYHPRTVGGDSLLFLQAGTLGPEENYAPGSLALERVESAYNEVLEKYSPPK